MDPNSRRMIWDIIRTLKNEGKTVILTTNFLDEADELSDQIAILKKGYQSFLITKNQFVCIGELFSMGTSDFIKKQFGKGYHLLISPK